MGTNGANNDDNSDDLEMGRDEDELEYIMHEDENKEKDSLCPDIPVTAEERNNLCRHWRKAIIIKLFGRRIGYKFMYGRLPKFWNISGEFELIDLQHDFFLVCFHENFDYECVLYDEPWMILGHYLTIQI